jgi:hypothetical protein
VTGRICLKIICDWRESGFGWIVETAYFLGYVLIGRCLSWFSGCGWIAGRETTLFFPDYLALAGAMGSRMHISFHFSSSAKQKGETRFCVCLGYFSNALICRRCNQQDSADGKAELSSEGWTFSIEGDSSNANEMKTLKCANLQR